MFNREKPGKEPNTQAKYSDPERRFHAALRSASNILGYAECSPARLREKLGQRGYEEQIINDVIDRLTQANLLRENDMAYRRAEALYRVKGYGPRRILPELRRLGFSSVVIENIEFDEEDFDFPARCAQMAKKRGEIDQKALAYLARLGYTGDQIRQALRILKNEE